MRLKFTDPHKGGECGYLDMVNQNGAASMTFYGDICSTTLEAWQKEDRTPQEVSDFLASLEPGQQIDLYFNSGGGDAYAGIAMHSIIRRWQGKKIGHVDAIAASAATLPLMACDEIEMAAGTMIMIHDPWTYAVGNATALREAADDLDQAFDRILDCYMLHAANGVTREQMAEAMHRETWMDQQLAAQYFRLTAAQTAAAAPAASMAYSNYKAAPAALLAAVQAQQATSAPADTPAAPTNDERAQGILGDLYLFGT